MTTIRRRLTLWYTVALAVTVLAFGTALYLERRQSGIRELDQRLSLEADLAHRWLSESYKVLGRIVTTSGCERRRSTPASVPISSRCATTSSWPTPRARSSRCPRSPGR